MAYSYDSVDLMPISVYSVKNRPQLGAPRKRFIAHDLGVRPGQRVASAVDGARAIVLEGCVEGTSASDLEAQVDTLKRVLDRPRKRLIAGFQDGRFYIPAACDFEETGGAGFYAEYRATFHLEHPYQFAATPSGDVRSPALALLPNQTTQYGLRYSLTPGGTRPAPLRALISNPAAGNTPTLVQIANSYDGVQRTRAITAVTALAPTELIAIDPDVEQVIKASMANVLGYWPLEDASSSALDFSGDARNLTAAGGLTYRADGVLGSAIDFNGTTGVFTSASTSFRLTTNSGSWGAWVKPDAIGSAMGVMSLSRTAEGYEIRLTAGGQFQALNRTETGNIKTVTGYTVAEVGKWYRVVATYSSSSGRLNLYVNGRLEASTTTNTADTVTATNDLNIGRAFGVDDNTSRFWDGAIDEPFVMDAALTDAQARDDHAYSLPYALRTSVLDLGGFYPELDPRVSTTNSILVRADHASSAPTPLVALAWRARWA